MMRVRFTVYASCLVLVLACLVPGSTSAQSDWSPELEDFARTLIENGDVRLTGDVVCEHGTGEGDFTNAYQGADGEALLRVAGKKRIYLYAHGLYTNPRRPKPPLSYALDTWRSHLRAARYGGSGYAACVFVLDTAAGFGPHQATVGNFLFALRALTDDVEFYDDDREVVLIGYSAGVNYLKQGLLTFQRHLAANNLATVGLASTKMRFVFLGGVHNGTEIVSLASAGVALLDALAEAGTAEPRTYEEISARRWANLKRSERELFLASRGLRQLRLGNSTLSRLNGDFLSALTTNIRLLNVVGTRDIIAPPISTHLRSSEELLIIGARHADFVGARLGSRFDGLMATLY